MRKIKWIDFYYQKATDYFFRPSIVPVSSLFIITALSELNVFSFCNAEKKFHISVHKYKKNQKFNCKYYTFYTIFGSKAFMIC